MRLRFVRETGKSSGRAWQLRLGLLVLLTALIGCTGAPEKADLGPEQAVKGEAVEPPVIRSSIEDYMKILSADNPQSGADGRVYYTTWSSGVDQVYRLTADGSQAVTTGDMYPEGIDNYSLSPDGRWMVILSDVGGDEQYDLCLLDLLKPESEPQHVDRGRDVRSEAITWAPDSRFFVYRSNWRSKADFDIWRYDMESGESELLIQLEGYIWPGDISPDGSRLCFVQYYGGDFSDLFLVDLKSMDIRRLTAEGREGGMYRSPRFTADGDGLFMITNDGLERDTLARMSLQDGSWFALSKVPWTVEDLALSPDGGLLAYTYNEQGYSRLDIRQPDTFEALAQPQLPMGVAVIRSLYATGKGVLFAASDPTRTKEIWRFRPAEGNFVQLTQSDYAGVDYSRFVRPELIRYWSFDGLEIPAFLYRPKGYGEKPAPYVIYAHGGPEGQFRPGFVRNFQYLLERGIGVLAPNVRGSSGYSRLYQSLDNYKKRMDAIDDFKTAAEWLKNNGGADPKRLGIMGGSYGGFVVMAGITRYPELFSAAINKVGVVNFLSYFKNTKSYRRKVRRAEYGPEDDEEFLRSISPIFKVAAIKTPLFVIHGENDPRVPVDEARQIIKALEDLNRPVESLIFPDEGHGIGKLENRLTYYRRMADFLTRWLKPDPEGEAGDDVRVNVP